MNLNPCPALAFDCEIQGILTLFTVLIGFNSTRPPFCPPPFVAIRTGRHKLLEVEKGCAAIDALLEALGKCGQLPLLPIHITFRVVADCTGGLRFFSTVYSKHVYQDSAINKLLSTTPRLLIIR